MNTVKIRTVSEVNRYINALMKDDFFLKRISVKGEVSNLNDYKRTPSGHIYFTLKDEAGGSEIPCAMWRSKRASGLKFTLQNGQQVVVSGSIEVYEAGGKYQLYANEIKPEGEGERYLKLMRLKEELAEMGMFEDEYKRPIPKYARTVGVVTSKNSAAIQDIRNVAGRRNPYVRIILSHARVQGDGASEEIAEALMRLDRIGCDVIILGRGGGPTEDLWAFNEKIVADAIFSCDTPIISAVGHEINWTIADLVADVRVPTPSAAAEIAIYEADRLDGELNDYYDRLNFCMSRRIDDAKSEASRIRKQLLLLSPEAKLSAKRDKLVAYERRLILSHPKTRVDAAREKAAHMGNALSADMERKISLARQRRDVLLTRLGGASPAKKLQSGFSYVTGASGHALRKASDIKIGEEIDIRLYKGSLKAEVTDIEEDIIDG